MTAVDVDALAKLREAATAGGWYEGSGYLGPAVFSDTPGRPGIGHTYIPADAALIVAAVNALPDLLAEVRRGRALREAVEGVVKELDDEADERADSNWLLAVGERSGLLMALTRLNAVLAAVDAS